MYSYIKGILTHSNRIIASKKKKKKKENGILILYQKFSIHSINAESYQSIITAAIDIL